MSEPTKPDAKDIPLPPPKGSDRAAWLRWAVSVALLLANLYFGNKAATEIGILTKPLAAPVCDCGCK